MIKSIRIRWAGDVARMGKRRSVFIILTGKSTGKRRLGRPRCRWEDNIRMDLKEISVNTMNSFDLGQERDYWGAHVNAALHFWV